MFKHWWGGGGGLSHICCDPHRCSWVLSYVSDCYVSESYRTMCRRLSIWMAAIAAVRHKVMWPVPYSVLFNSTNPPSLDECSLVTDYGVVFKPRPSTWMNQTFSWLKNKNAPQIIFDHVFQFIYRLHEICIFKALLVWINYLKLKKLWVTVSQPVGELRVCVCIDGIASRPQRSTSGSTFTKWQRSKEWDILASVLDNGGRWRHLVPLY